MIKFNEVPFSDFKELVLFLKFGDDENEYHNITKRKILQELYFQNRKIA